MPASSIAGISAAGHEALDLRTGHASGVPGEIIAGIEAAGREASSAAHSVRVETGKTMPILSGLPCAFMLATTGFSAAAGKSNTGVPSGAPEQRRRDHGERGWRTSRPCR